MKKIKMNIRPAKSIRGKIALPGDKSISHRAVMIGSIAEGRTRIENFLSAGDCLSTVEAFKAMGVAIDRRGNAVSVEGAGLKGLKRPDTPLYAGNSGTTMRLLMGILAGQDFECTISGDESLSHRPMKRVTGPLRRMGAHISGRDDANLAPLTVRGGNLRGIDYESPVASAQVKSSILLAGLYADGTTSVTEPFRSRDHTERMLGLFGAPVSTEGRKTSVKKCGGMKGARLPVPGDISSAAFFIVAALLGKDSELIMRGAGCNKTRTGAIDILKRMGADINITGERGDWEPVCDLTVRSSRLKAAKVDRTEIPRCIDELPILMVAASLAEGRSVISGAGELRVKETDRIASLQKNLNKMGARISTDGDDVIIEGVRSLNGAELSSYGDHRTAMAVSVAALTCERLSVIDDISCVDISFPGFYDMLKSVSIY